jgi:hypothetical protein
MVVILTHCVGEERTGKRLIRKDYGKVELIVDILFVTRIKQK